jgi:hypothetical protein
MSKSKSLPVLVLVVGALLVQPADAATVRRHVHCTTVAGGITITFLIPTTTPGIASITNNGSAPIPAGAAFTLTVAGRHPRTFTLPQELAPGASFGAGHPDITGPGQTCDASYLDTGYQSGGPPPPPQPRKPKFPVLPKQGVFTSN